MKPIHEFEFRYDVTIPDKPKGGGEVCLWLPCPVDGRGQEILDVKIDTNMDYLVEHDHQFGNSIIYAVDQLSGPSYFNMYISARRTEISIETSQRAPFNMDVSPHFNSQLIENRYIKFTSEIKSVAKSIQSKHDDSLMMARAAFDYVLENMDYDKSGDGWGEGSTEYACAMGKGNCTDFHSLFIGILRSMGIPAQFEIGVAFPDSVEEADITYFKCGYHCWATFFVPRVGWVPADCSEAAQKPDLVNYYFGSIDSNRILLSRGRDLVMQPPSSSDPQNFFTDPVVENASGSAMYYEKKLSFKTISKRGYL